MKFAKEDAIDLGFLEKDVIYYRDVLNVVDERRLSMGASIAREAYSLAGEEDNDNVLFEQNILYYN